MDPATAMMATQIGLGAYNTFFNKPEAPDFPSRQEVDPEGYALRKQLIGQLQQSGQQTGALQHLMQGAARESYDQSLAGLASRGVTGGTPEFELAQRGAETQGNIAAQSSMYDQDMKLRLLSALEGGLQGQTALASQQAQFGYGQQQQQQSDLMNLLGLTGQAVGGGMGGNMQPIGWGQYQTPQNLMQYPPQAWQSSPWLNRYSGDASTLAPADFWNPRPRGAF